MNNHEVDQSLQYLVDKIRNSTDVNAKSVLSTFAYHISSMTRQKIKTDIKKMMDGHDSFNISKFDQDSDIVWAKAHIAGEVTM
jgi:hypothetical protein